MENKIKIVFVCGWYSSPFGYISNNLPKALAQKGCDVHIVTSTSQQYSNTPDYEKTYRSFLGPPYTNPGIYSEFGVTIHRLPVAFFKTEVLPKGVFQKLKSLKPDVVHIFDVGSLLTFKLAFFRLFLRYKLINSNHIHYSVFPMHAQWKNLSFWRKMKWKLLHVFPGKFIYSQTFLSINPHDEGKTLSKLYFGFGENKSIVKSLAVDTNLYKPIDTIERNQERLKLGFDKEDFVAVYSGRFSEDKNPLILAKAIHLLQSKYPNIKGLFVGNGVQENQILSLKGCICHPFTDQNTLVKLYGISDVGVWPRQESTSMLDCLSCGVPIIVNDTVELKERVEGNGLYFKFDDAQNLAEQIENLYLNSELRAQFSNFGRNKVISHFSWEKYAGEYIELIQ